MHFPILEKQAELYNICPYVSSLFHLACFQGSTMLLHVSELFPFYGRISLHCVYIPCLVYPYASVDGHLGCFHLLAIMKSAAANIGIPIFV